MSYDQAIRQVAKLLKLAEHANTNAEEAATAAAKAQDIMTRFKISRLSVETGNGVSAGDGDQDEAIVNFATVGAPLIAPTDRLARWLGQLAVVVARANQCVAYANTTAKGKSIELVGRASDAETVRYLFAALRNEIDRLTRVHGKGCGRVWCTNFRTGVVDAIADKLTAQAAETAASLRREAQGQGQTNALIVVNNALAKLAQRANEVEKFAKQSLRLRAGRSTAGGRYDASARDAGRRAGANIDVGGGARRSLGNGARRLTAGG